MKIVVLAKEVPDTYGTRTLDLTTGLAERGRSEAVLDEIGERALEVALAHAESHPSTEVVVLAMGPESAVGSLRKALAMGADSAVHVTDPALAGSDLLTTAEVLAAAVRRTGFDLVIAGNRSTDGSGGALPAALAEFLGVAAAPSLSTVTISDGSVTGERQSGTAVQRVEADLPAVISITEALPDPRFPNVKGIMAAKRKPLETLTVGDLGVDVADESAAHSIVVAIAERPPRSSGMKVVDDGTAADQLVAYLADAKLL